MNIIYFIDSLNSGGRERRFFELIKTIHQNTDINCEVIILSKKIFYQDIQNLTFPIHYIERKVKKDFSVFIHLYRICKNFRPDIIHSWHFMCSIYAIPIAYLLRIVLLSDVIADAPLKIRYFTSLWIKSKIVTLFSQHINANSEAGLKSYEVPNKKSSFIHNGFAFPRLDNLKKPEILHSRFNINTKNIVGMIARFTDQKDHKSFILCAQEILAIRKDVTFILVGDGPLRKDIERLVTFPFLEHIIFLGEQDDVESIINILDIGVLSTITEGISNAIIEYMALGKPVVATDGGGTNELVVQNKTGFLIYRGDVSGMVEKICYLLDNPEVAKSMGDAGAERIKSEFSMDLMTKSYLQLYNKLEISRS